MKGEESVDSKQADFFLYHGLSRLSPDVFSHKIWVNYCEADQPATTHLIEGLQEQIQQSIDQGDIICACQILLICAAIQKRCGDLQISLTSLQRTWELAEMHGLNLLSVWAAWGVSALYAYQGDLQQAAKPLQWLQRTLMENGDWVLANLVELIQITMTHQGEQVSLARALDWLTRWGEPPGMIERESGRGRNPEQKPAALLEAREIRNPLQTRSPRSWWKGFWTIC